MKDTVTVDDNLLHRAQQLSGLRQKAAVLNAGLQALIARETARRLIALGGTDRNVKRTPRRRARVGR